jgi:sec-independent protein translocase protein TatA
MSTIIALPLWAVFWNLGAPELLIFAFVMVLLFGHRLPSVMRSLGRGVVEFKKGVKGIEEDLEDGSQDAKRVEHSPKEV